MNLTYKTCEDCGSKLYSLGCLNCNEMEYIETEFAEEIGEINNMEFLEEEK